MTGSGVDSHYCPQSIFCLLKNHILSPLTSTLMTFKLDDDANTIQSSLDRYAVDKVGPVQTERCVALGLTARMNTPKKKRMSTPQRCVCLSQHQLLGSRFSSHQQATLRAHSLTTLLEEIKSDQHIYKAKHFKNPRVCKFLKILFNIATGAACSCEQNIRNIDVLPSASH